MISVYLDGRLGNQMFQYAICRIVAEKNGYKWFIPNGNYNENNDNPHLWMGDELFEIDLGIRDMQLNNNFFDSPSQVYNPNVFNVNDGTMLRGFFQTDKYYTGFEDKIKNWFKLKECQISDEKLLKYKDYCFIHFRGGDYKNLKNIFLPQEYYDEAKRISGFDRFVIVTDDYDLAKEYFPNDIIESNNTKIDFNLLCKSKNLIISNSSFSWWSAWLNDDCNVIAPMGWFAYNDTKVFSPVDIATKKFKYI